MKLFQIGFLRLIEDLWAKLLFVDDNNGSTDGVIEWCGKNVFRIFVQKTEDIARVKDDTYSDYVFFSFNCN